MILYLVRHGQSEGNVLRTFHGQTDYPLTDFGREQARQAGQKLRGVPFTRCVASDLARAWETAALCLEGRDVVPEPCPALREQFVGEMEGLSWEEMESRFPHILRPYLEDWFSAAPPGGELPREMFARVGACVDGLLEAGEDTLVVAHNGSLSLILIHLGLLDRSGLTDPRFWFAQGVYSAVRVEGGRAELLVFNQ